MRPWIAGTLIGVGVSVVWMGGWWVGASKMANECTLAMREIRAAVSDK